MTRLSRQPSVHHRLVAALLIAHVLAMLALTASPRLHHWVHPDADDEDHDCAVVLFLHGGCHHAPPPIATPVRVDLTLLPCSGGPRRARVAAAFAQCYVLEHAPPAETDLPHDRRTYPHAA